MRYSAKLPLLIGGILTMMILSGCGKKTSKTLEFGHRTWEISSEYNNYFVSSEGLGDMADKALAFTMRDETTDPTTLSDNIIIVSYQDTQASQTNITRREKNINNLPHLLGYKILSSQVKNIACEDEDIAIHSFSFTDSPLGDIRYYSTQGYLVDDQASYVISFTSPSPKASKKMMKQLTKISCQKS